MSIKAICECDVVTVDKEASIHDTAKIMKKYNVGNVVVVDSIENNNKPIGIITDRDIVIKIVADEGDAKQICAGDAMSEDLLVLKSYQGIQEALDMMSAKGVRRAPIINDENKLVGIATVDDLFMLIAEEANSLAKLIRKQVARVKK
jgi:CBS domain-containing protein